MADDREIAEFLIAFEIFMGTKEIDLADIMVDIVRASGDLTFSQLRQDVIQEIVATIDAFEEPVAFVLVAIFCLGCSPLPGDKLIIIRFRCLVVGMFVRTEGSVTPFAVRRQDIRIQSVGIGCQLGFFVQVFIRSDL